MHARDLARPYPAVMVDQEACTYAIVRAAQVIRTLVPQYVLVDPILAAVIDDRFDDEPREAVTGRSVAEWLPRGRLPPAWSDQTSRRCTSPRSWPARTVRSSP